MRSNHRPSAILTCQTDKMDEYTPLNPKSSRGSGSESCSSPRLPPKNYTSMTARAVTPKSPSSTRASLALALCRSRSRSRCDNKNKKSSSLSSSSSSSSSSNPYPYPTSTESPGPDPGTPRKAPPPPPPPTTTTTTITSPQKREAAAGKLTDIEALTFLFLWWRVTDAASPYPILGDAYAGPTWARCEADDMRHPWMSQRAAAAAAATSPPPDPRWVSFVCHRTRTIDAWTQAFIDGHTEAGRKVQVLHVGCGLDARHLRVRWGRNVRWVDVDLPAVTDLRRRVMPSSLGEGEQRKNYRLRTLDITVEGWFRDSKCAAKVSHHHTKKESSKKPREEEKTNRILLSGQ